MKLTSYMSNTAREYRLDVSFVSTSLQDITIKLWAENEVHAIALGRLNVREMIDFCNQSVTQARIFITDVERGVVVWQEILDM